MLPGPTTHRRNASAVLAASIVSLLFATSQSPTQAADGIWTRNTSPTAPATHNWSDATHWFGGIIADGVDANAFLVYNPGISGGDVGANITLDSDRTLGRIFMTDIDGQSSSSVSLGGINSSTLTLETSTGRPTIDAGLLINNTFGSKKAILNTGFTLAGSDGFDKTGLGLLSLRMTDSMLGSINVLGGTLDTRIVLNHDIFVSGGSVLSLDFASATPANNLIGATQALSLGGATGSGYVTNAAKASTNHSQTVSSLAVNRGGNAITATNAGATFTTTWNLGTITRTAGGALNLATSGAGTSTFNFTLGGSVTGNDSSGIIGGWATYNSNDWAVANGSVINAAGVTYTNNTWGSNLNTTVNGANFPALPGVNTQTDATTHTLRFQDGSARLLALSGTNTIETGGILFGNSGNSMHQITGGSLKPGAGVSDLTVHSYSNGGGWGTIIQSDIIDNGAPVQLVKAGNGNLVLDGDKSFTGGTSVGQGTLVLGKSLGGSNTGSVQGDIVNSGVLAFNRSGTFTPTNQITGNGVVAQWSEGNLVLTKTVSAGGLDLRNGTTTLDFSAAGAPASNIVPAGELTTNGLYTGGGRLSLRDATLNVVGAAGAATVQHFALTDFQGSSSINLTPGSGGTVALELGAYLRPNNNNEGAGTLKLSLPVGASLLTQLSFPGAAKALVADGGQAFVTVNGNDWGAKDAANTQIVAGSSIPGFYSNLSALTAGSNADYNADTTVSAATTLGSLRFNTVTSPGTLTVNSGMQLKLGGVLVTPDAAAATTIAGPGTISAASTGGRDLIVFQNSAQPLTISAIIANNSTAAADTTNIVKEGAGELILSGANTYTGKTYVQGGLLRVTAGTIGTSAAVASNVFIREGAMRLENNASVNTGGNYVAIGQRLGEVGTLTLSGTSVWSTAADFNVADVNATGTLNVQDSATLNANNFFVGKAGSAVGTVNLSGGTIAVTTGSTDIRIGGNNASDSLAQGTINQTGGTFNLNRNFQLGAHGVGVYNQSGGTFKPTAGFTGIGRYVSGRGTWNLSGGTIDLSASGTGAALIVGEQGSGVLNVSNTGNVLAKSLTLGHSSGVGIVHQTGGSVSLSATGSVTFGIAFQTGLILAPQGTTAEGTYYLSGGTLSTQAISKGAGTGVFNFDGGTVRPIANNPTFMNGLTAANIQAGGARVDTNGFDITINQSLRHDPALLAVVDGGVTKSGAGTLTVSGESNYTGSTSVSAGTLLVSGSLSGTTALNISGGTFRLGGTDLVNDAASVSLSGGTFSTAGFAETLGAFTLQGTATLDLGNGASILHFANSSAAAWTGALSITNWDGSALGGGTDQIFFGTASGGLASSQLAMIQFINPAGFAPGSYEAGILSTGEIVAVPEPSAVISLLGGVGLLLGMRRRRA